LVFQIFIPFCVETENIKPEDFQLINEIYPAFMLDVDFQGKKKITLKTNELPIVKYDMNFYKQVEENELIGLKYEKIERKQNTIANNGYS